MTYSVQSIFGCGIERETFQAKYVALSDKERAQIERVAWRMWVSVALRYHVFVNVPLANSFDLDRLMQDELPASSLFTLFGCIDTLAQQTEYVSFIKWFDAQTDAESFSRKEVKKLYRTYADTIGVGANLRRLFARIPQATVQWLTRHVVIMKSGEDPATGRLTNERDIMNGIFEYFYNIRRNPYAHQSVSHPVYVAPDIGLGEGRVFTPTTSEYMIDGQAWDLEFTHGIDEEIILKVIIQAAVLGNIGIEVAEAIIEAFFNHQSRQSAMYGFTTQVRQNARFLSSLKGFDENAHSDLNYYLYYQGVPYVGYEWATTLAERLIVEDNTMESGLKSFVTQYATMVQQLNEAIRTFNTTHPRARPTTGDLPARIQTIKTFLEAFTHTPDFLFVKQVPSLAQIANIELVARDPCYT